MTDLFNKAGKTVIGMSGGVDSSVAAFLLKEQGLELLGVFMKNWEEKDDDVCTSAQDFEDAREVCAKLRVPYYPANFTKEYMDNVFSAFLREYAAGRTPNPDVLCNSEIKFKAFLDFAVSAGAERIATGHYARVEYADGLYRLLKAKDLNKDQSYFLCMLGQRALSRAIFPLGDYLKPEVRAIAAANGIPTAKKKDSTGICFIGERNFRQFLSQYFAPKPGDIKTLDGKALGRHDGLVYYTIGQRKGMGIGGTELSLGGGRPWFVVKKEHETNTLYVAPGKDAPELYSSRLCAEPLHFIAEVPPKKFECTAKIRYRQEDQRCLVAWDEHGCRVEFENPQRAVTPGQYIVLYNKDECLGGATIRGGRNQEVGSKGG